MTFNSFHFDFPLAKLDHKSAFLSNQTFNINKLENKFQTKQARVNINSIEKTDREKIEISDR